MSGKLRSAAREREREGERDGGTRGVHDDVSVRRGDVARVPPPSRTPLLHATATRRREGEEGGESDDDDGEDDGEYRLW